MSFIDITDPKKRDAIVADYLTTVKRIQQRNLDERAQELARDEDVHNLFKPVVRSTEKSTAALTKELIPMRTELKNINERLRVDDGKDVVSKDGGMSSSSLDLDKVEEFSRAYDVSKLDNYFGIVRTEDDGEYVVIIE